MTEEEFQQFREKFNCVLRKFMELGEGETLIVKFTKTGKDEIEIEYEVEPA